jgi:hypothetical protein
MDANKGKEMRVGKLPEQSKAKMLLVNQEMLWLLVA